MFVIVPLTSDNQTYCMPLNQFIVAFGVFLGFVDKKNIIEHNQTDPLSTV